MTIKIITAKEVKKLVTELCFNPKTDPRMQILAKQDSCSFYEREMRVQLENLIVSADESILDAASYKEYMINIARLAVLSIHTMEKLNGTSDPETKR